MGADMIILNIISQLMDYPSAALAEHQSEIIDAIEQSTVAPEIKTRLVQFAQQELSTDLLDRQETYDGLFERGRSLGLWLFEHVHGESRDRGQAMVDLVDKYREAGLEINQQELPDYIPMFLEFLATQGEENAKQWLQDVEHILALLQCRLEKRQSPYSVLFESLLDIAQSDVSLDEVRASIAEEKRDDTKEAIDAEWEEEEVKFGPESMEENSACSSAVNRPSEGQRRDTEIPLNWVDFDTSGSAGQRA